MITPLKIDISTGDAITPHEVRYSFTGIKYHSTLQNYYQQIRGISDRLCAENGLSVILQGERTKTVSYIEWLRQSKGQPTFRSMLEADLRDAITDANDLGHFFLLMEHKGYEIHHGNRLGFRLRGQERYMYPERKNAAFSEENIERTIAGNLAEIEAGIRPAFLPRPKPQPYRPHPKYNGIRVRAICGSESSTGRLWFFTASSHERKSGYLRAACTAQQADPCRAAKDQAVPRDCRLGSGHAARCRCTGKIPP